MVLVSFSLLALFSLAAVIPLYPPVLTTVIVDADATTFRIKVLNLGGSIYGQEVGSFFSFVNML